MPEKPSMEKDQVEHPSGQDRQHNQSSNPYDEDDQVQPKLHARTYVAAIAMCVLSFNQTFALYGVATALSWIGADLDVQEGQSWVPNAVNLTSAVMGPLVSCASDAFQLRKPLLIGACLAAFVGSAIIPGAQSLARIIAGQLLVGFGFSGIPLAYCVPSEILPRRWRPMVQSMLNVAAAMGSISGPLIVAALQVRNPNGGWRNYFWIQMGLWGLGAIGTVVGYRPLKGHNHLEDLSLVDKLRHLDLPGCSILLAGLTLFLVGLNLGGGLFNWTNVRVIVTLVLGGVLLACFAVYEWKWTRVGIIHHDMYSLGKSATRNLTICFGLMCGEAILLFSILIFYPVMTARLFDRRPVQMAARGTPCWIAAALATTFWAYWSVKFRTIRAPMFWGFALWTAGIVGLATIQPGDDFSQLAFVALAGIGFGGPLVLIIAGVQLSAPHAFIGTATAVTMSFRAFSATIFVAIYSAVLSTRLEVNIPAKLAPAVLEAGLPPASISTFIAALTANDMLALGSVNGVTPLIIAAGRVALRQAWADSLRYIYIIAAAFGALACVGSLFLGDIKRTMNYHVDAPVERLQVETKTAGA